MANWNPFKKKPIVKKTTAHFGHEGMSHDPFPTPEQRLAVTQVSTWLEAIGYVQSYDYTTWVHEAHILPRMHETPAANVMAEYPATTQQFEMVMVMDNWKDYLHRKFKLLFCGHLTLASSFTQKIHDLKEQRQAIDYEKLAEEHFRHFDSGCEYGLLKFLDKLAEALEPDAQLYKLNWRAGNSYTGKPDPKWEKAKGLHDETELHLFMGEKTVLFILNSCYQG